MRLLPVGGGALLAEVGSLEESRALHGLLARAVESGRLPGVVDLVPAARTVLVSFDPGRTTAKGVAAAVRALAGAAGQAFSSGPGRVHRIEIVYDGEDLPVVAEHLGAGVESVIERHAALRWEVAFAGFAPGFAYLAAEGAPRVPRRASPRTSVPAGSVALADDWCGVYPRSSPGGWQLIGRTDAALWQIDRTPPALLAPGDAVRFVAVEDLPPVTTPPDAGPMTSSGSRAIEVLAVGPAVTLQDRGRPGYAAVGLGRSGAADRSAHHLALRLTGCPDDAATIEVTLGGLVARARDDLLVAVTGATVPVTIDGRPQGCSAVLRWPRGTELRLGAPVAGLRSYLAVTGGWQADRVLGSRSYDTLSGTGPRPLRAGDVVAAGMGGSGQAPAVDLAVSGPADPGRLSADPVVLSVTAGPRADWFSEQAWDLLTSATWSVTADVDRVGARLDGPVLERAVTDELPSEGMVRGSVQVSSDGRPTIFLADHPVTGGYPVIAVLTDESCDRAAQLVPGTQVRLSRAGAPAGRPAPRR